MMRRRFLLFCLPLALVACGAASQQKLALPAVAPSKARLVFYRGGNPYDGLVWTKVLLNGRSIGAAGPGTVFYRDVSPGVYQIGVSSEKLYPDQVKAVAIDAGSTTYIKVMGAPTWGQSGLQWSGSTFTPAVMAPAVGQYEIGPLQLTSG